jgi:hypothetical protein
MRLLKRDMQNRTDALDDQIGAIRRRIRKAGAPETTTPTTTTAPPEGTQKPIPGLLGGVAEYRQGKWIRVK